MSHVTLTCFTVASSELAMRLLWPRPPDECDGHSPTRPSQVSSFRVYQTEAAFMRHMMGRPAICCRICLCVIFAVICDLLCKVMGRKQVLSMGILASSPLLVELCQSRSYLGFFSLPTLPVLSSGCRGLLAAGLGSYGLQAIAIRLSTMYVNCHSSRLCTRGLSKPRQACSHPSLSNGRHCSSQLSVVAWQHTSLACSS